MRTAAILFAALILCASPAQADRFSLAYEGYALGVLDLGGLTVDADLSDNTYQVNADMHSGGLLNWFERTQLRGNATGVIAQGAVRWQTYNLDHHYSRKHRVISMRAGADGAVSREITPNYRIWGDPPASDEQRRGARDPLSTMMAMAVDVNLTHRCSGDYPVFDGRFYYLLELGGGQIGHFDGGGYDGPILKCSLAYIAVAGFERNDIGRRRFPHGEVWFALVPDSDFGPPVRFSLPLSTGGAVVRLSRFRRVRVLVGDASPN